MPIRAAAMELPKKVPAVAMVQSLRGCTKGGIGDVVPIHSWYVTLHVLIALLQLQLNFYLVEGTHPKCLTPALKCKRT